MDWKMQHILPLHQAVRYNRHRGKASAGVMIYDGKDVVDCFSYAPGHDEYLKPWLERITERVKSNRTIIFSQEPSLTDAQDPKQPHPMAALLPGFGSVFYLQPHPLHFRRDQSRAVAQLYPGRLPDNITTNLFTRFWHVGSKKRFTKDREYIQRALGQAKKCGGHKKPYVGAVLVQWDGKMLGADYHRRRHATGISSSRGKRFVRAEVGAIKQARGENHDLTRARLYTTLEPTAPGQHEGMSASEFIVSSGIEQVLIGMQNHPQDAGGRGIEYLRKHGVQAFVLAPNRVIAQSDMHILDNLRGPRGRPGKKLHTILDSKRKPHKRVSSQR